MNTIIIILSTSLALWFVCYVAVPLWAMILKYFTLSDMIVTEDGELVDFDDTEKYYD